MTILEPGSSGGSFSSSPDKIKVGVIPIVDVAPFYIGKEQDFFSKRKIDLTLEQARGGAAIVPAVVSGQHQFGFSNVVSLMLAGALPAGRCCSTRSRAFGASTRCSPTPAAIASRAGSTCAVSLCERPVGGSSSAPGGPVDQHHHAAHR